MSGAFNIFNLTLIGSYSPYKIYVSARKKLITHDPAHWCVICEYVSSLWRWHFWTRLAKVVVTIFTCFKNSDTLPWVRGDDPFIMFA
jgi:hypothetical protein